MDEFQIASSIADVLNRLCYSNNISEDQQGVGQCGMVLGVEELQLAKLHAMKAKLAMSRASENHQDFETVLKETELAVSMELAKILAKSVDPLLGGLTKMEIEKEGDVCGVCLDEMELGCEARAMGCEHVFHAYCIVKWLKQKNSCPLCRCHHVEATGNTG